MAFTDKDLQKIIGAVLKYGVWLVLFIAISGGIIYLINHGQETVHYSTFVEKDQGIFTVIGQIFNGVGNLQGEAVIFLGILLLFFTPFLRLLLSLVSFLLEKDWLYVTISLVVLGIICLSVSFGFAH